MKKALRIIKKRIHVLVTELSLSRGFSLMELMIVIVIISILSLLVVPRLLDIPKKARVQAVKQQISSFGLALDRYYLDSGIYPTTEQGLDAIVKKPNTEPLPMNYNNGGYMKKNAIPKDPWGRDFLYTSPGEHGNDYEIMSYGADGKEGGENENADIKSWE